MTGIQAAGGRMITQLYIERLGDGRYDVVCNDYAVTTKVLMRSDIGDLDGIGFAISTLTAPERDECEYADDMAGVRVGYLKRDLFGVAYGGEVRAIPDFQLARTIEHLMAGAMMTRPQDAGAGEGV